MHQTPTRVRGCPPGLGERCGLRSKPRDRAHQAQGAGGPQAVVFHQECRHDDGLRAQVWGLSRWGAPQPTQPAAVPLRKVPEVRSTDRFLHRTRLLLRQEEEEGTPLVLEPDSRFVGSGSGMMYHNHTRRSKASNGTTEITKTSHKPPPGLNLFSVSTRFLK